MRRDPFDEPPDDDPYELYASEEEVFSADTHVDPAEERAVAELRDRFKQDRVFYSRQLEVQLEGSFFHWVTNRAVKRLVAEDHVVAEERDVENSSSVNLLWRKSYRYPRREAAKVHALVEEYSRPAVSEAVGSNGENLVLEGFSRHQFVQRGRNVNAFGAKAWQRTNQDIDFIFERDGHAYGIEVKNALGYMDKDEFDSKSDLCFELDLIPVFVVRMVPRTWLEELRKLGGFVLVIKFQLYPKLLGPLASRMRDELGLPVDTPATLWEGTMERFLKWHHAPSGDGDS